MGTFGLLLLSLTAFNAIIVSAIPTIQAIGSKFFTSDGKQFFMKGIAYQLINNDPLVDVEQCSRDISLMKQLGANAIRVYHVDATADHSGCMSALAQAEMYLFVDLDSFASYVRYAESGPSWTQNKSNAYRAVMDTFQQYENTAGFFVGNEVLNSIKDSGAAPFVLAAAVDMAAYRDARGYRNIPIGYSATDTGALPMLQDYFVCRPNETERLEFYALNSYRWCGAQATYNTSGYNALQEEASGYPIPIFFSEVGCNQPQPRYFNDQNAIFGSEMADTWSGSIIYEWLEEVNDYGLIMYGPKLDMQVQIGTSIIDGITRKGTPTPISPDFTNLKSRWATLTPTGSVSSAYVHAITSKSRACPAFTSGGWTVDPGSPLPTLGQTALQSVTAVSSSSSEASSILTTTTRPASDTHSSSAATSATSSGAATKNVQNLTPAWLTDDVPLNVTFLLGVITAALMLIL